MPARRVKTDQQAADLSDLDHVITVRWDRERQCPVVNLDGMAPHAAYMLLFQATEQINEELPTPIVEP